MKTIRTPVAKILNHADGLGAPTLETVQKRAEELALIDGRTEANEGDWQAAKAELHGGHTPLWSNGDDEMVSSVSERDMVVADIGHHVQNIRYDDEETGIELVAEGMDEAVHEQMLEAAEQSRREDRLP